MATPSAFEQLTVELINQARLNPHGEYDRLVVNAPANVLSAINFFDVNLTVLAAQFAALTPVAPVAWNESLGNSSDTYSALMLVLDTQSHTLDGLGLFARFAGGGYTNANRAGENIFAFAEDAFHSHAGFFIDWGSTSTGIQNPPGHRNSIMSANFTELGVGHVVGTGDGSGPGSPVGPNIVTHHLANRTTYTSQVVGVVFDDGDGDRFYDMGEGLAGATVSSGATTANGFSTGGFNLDLAAGTHTLTFASGLGTAAINVALGTDNIKVDMYDPGAFRSSVTATLGTGGVAIELLGEAAINATGNAGANTLIGNGAANVLDGGANPQTGPGAGGDVMLGGAGNDTYVVDSAYDYIAEGGGGGPAGGAGDIDTINSSAYFYWDYFSVGENLNILGGASTIDVTTGVDIGVSTIVGGAFNSVLTGNAGNNNIYVNWGDDTVYAKAGTDHIDFTDRAAGATGVNTLIFERGNGYDIVWNFLPGADTLDVSAFDLLDFAQLRTVGFDDGIGNCYFALGTDYLFVIGQTLSDLSAGDFIV